MSTAQYATPTTSIGPSVQWKQGGAGNTLATASEELVHPNALYVGGIQSGEPGYWLRFSDAAAVAAGVPDVTHIHVDTPYPDFADSYENPVLFYSTDDNASRDLWPAFGAEPLDPWPGTGYNSDPCLAIKADGSLYVAWRWWNPGTVAATWEYQVISGTHLTDATKSATATATTPMDDWVAPSIVQYGGLWHAFVVDMVHDTLASATGDVLRWTSNDEGETWAADGSAFSPIDTVEAETGIRERYWHGSITGPFSGGWFFGLYSCNDQGTSGGNASFRTFRSQDLETWERSDRYMMMWGETGTIAVTRHYQGSVIEQTSGHAVLFSGYNNDLYRVGVLTGVDPHSPFDAPPGNRSLAATVTVAGGWRDHNGSTANADLLAGIQTAGDGAYIETGDNPAADLFECALADLSGTGATMDYEIGKSGAAQCDIVVQLRSPDGVTLVREWTHTNVATFPVSVSQDISDLSVSGQHRVRVTATAP